MPLSIQPAQGQGVANLAAKNMPSMGLQPYGAGTPLYGQNILEGAKIAAGMQTSQNALAQQQALAEFQAQQEAQRQAAVLKSQEGLGYSNQANQMQMQLMQIAAQQERAKQEDLFKQQQLNLQQQQVAQTGAYQSGMLGQGQQEIAVKKAQLEIEAMKALQPQKLAELGASNATMLMGLSQYAGDPAKLAAFIEHQNKLDVKAGVVTQEEADQRKTMDPAELQQLAMRNVIMAGMASGGSQTNTAAAALMPPMTNVYGNLPATKEVTGDTTKSVVAKQQALIGVDRLLTNFDPEIFTYAGQAKEKVQNVIEKSPDAIANIANKIGDMTGILPKNSRDLSQVMASFHSNVLGMAADVLNQQQGVRFNESTLKVLEPILPNAKHDSADDAFYKLVTFQQRLKGAVQFESELLQKGIKPDSKEFEDKVLNYLQTAPASGKIMMKFSDGKTKELTYEDISKVSKQNNQPINAVIQFALQNQAQ